MIIWKSLMWKFVRSSLEVQGYNTYQMTYVCMLATLKEDETKHKAYLFCWCNNNSYWLGRQILNFSHASELPLKN